MSDAVFSAEYAASLVQRARDGATFVHASYAEGAFACWEPIVSYDPSDDPQYPGRGGRPDHWVAWYRETHAAHLLLWDVCKFNHIFEPAIYHHQERADVKVIRDAIGDLMDDFAKSLFALGSLCQLPPEWTDAHREAAREIGGG